MNYNDYYLGMSAIWWIIWLVLLFWIFAVPYDIPGQRSRKDSPLEILKKRFANGQMTKEEFEAQKDILLKR
ncbi:MAG: SHOCT domain-containing protein [Flavobacterium sp.]|nr:SHOCT domain-containing protein [Flavobacterium sp.]